MPDVNEILRDATLRHAHYLERFTNSELRKVRKLLEDADRDLAARIAAKVDAMSDADKVRFAQGAANSTARMKALQKTLRDMAAEYDAALKGQLGPMLRDLAVAEGEFNRTSTQRALPVRYTVQAPTANALKAIATKRPFQGKLLKDWTRDWSQAKRAQTAAAVRQGMALGEGSQTIARRVRDVGQVSRRSAETITRTAVNHISNAAQTDLAKSNPGLIKAYRWESVLDGRTSSICRSNDGRTFKPAEAQGKLPAHLNCRSRMAPVTYADRAFQKIPGRERTSMTGQVPADTNYNQWLTGQSAKFQNEVLGPTRAKLFRQGDLPLDKMVDRSGREYTLAELRSRNGELFDELGL